MEKRQCGLMLAIALIAGFVGGVISNQFFVGQPVFAGKNPNKPSDTLEVQRIATQELLLKNDAGEIRAVFNLQSPDDLPMLMMLGKRSKTDSTIPIAVMLKATGDDGSLILSGSGGVTELSGKTPRLNVKSITTQELFLKNDAGERLAEFSLGSLGNLPRLIMFAEPFKPDSPTPLAAMLEAGDGNGGLILSGERGGIQLYGKSSLLNVNKITTQALHLINDAGEQRALFGLSKSDDRPSLVIFGKYSKTDPKRKAVAILSAIDDDNGFLSLAGKGGQIGLDSGEDGVNISLADKNGLRRAVMGSAETENVETGVTTKYPPSSLILYNEKAKVLWRAP